MQSMRASCLQCRLHHLDEDQLEFALKEQKLSLANLS